MSSALSLLTIRFADKSSTFYFRQWSQRTYSGNEKRKTETESLANYIVHIYSLLQKDAILQGKQV